MAKINTDSKKIKELLERGVEQVYPTKGFLEKKLKEGKKLSLYLGIDPTGPTLHLGHAIALMKLKEWQEMGHEAVLLIGSFTGMIGDPTDKSAVRKQLTRQQVMANAKKYKKQAEMFISFSGSNPAKMVYNHEWLDKLTLRDMAELGMQVTTQRLLERDMFQERLKKGAPIAFTELMYPLLQGYDSVAMNIDGEIGGNDQTFNMLMGRDLLKKIKNKEKFVVTMKLLADPTGKKMGKTENNAVTLEDNAEEMFGKVMSWPDSMIGIGLDISTRVPKEDIKKILKKGKKEQKLDLAEEIVKIYHGEKKAEGAKEGWIKVFSNKETPDQMEEIKPKKKSCCLVDFLYDNKLADSKGVARRLVEQGGVRIDGKQIKDIHQEISFTGGKVVKIGKKKFVRIKN